jgi:hypothetical protein
MKENEDSASLGFYCVFGFWFFPDRTPATQFSSDANFS